MVQSCRRFNCSETTELVEMLEVRRNFPVESFRFQHNSKLSHPPAHTRTIRYDETFIIAIICFVLCDTQRFFCEADSSSIYDISFPFLFLRRRCKKLIGNRLNRLLKEQSLQSDVEEKEKKLDIKWFWRMMSEEKDTNKLWESRWAMGRLVWWIAMTWALNCSPHAPLQKVLSFLLPPSDGNVLCHRKFQRNSLSSLTIDVLFLRLKWLLWFESKWEKCSYSRR